MLATKTNFVDNDRNLIKSTHKIKRKESNRRFKLLLTCVVCDGEAHGYNFDAISCESCKAFFRRNALRPPGKLKCFGNGHCNVSFNQRKRCKKCRLEKCFRKGMRKEWILTEKEKQEKRIKIEQNRRLRQIQEQVPGCQQHIKKDCKNNLDQMEDVEKLVSGTIHEIHLDEIDWGKIELIQNAYIEAVKLNQTAGISQYPSIQSIGSTLELFRVPIYISSMRLITYFKQIPEFQQFDKEEQVYFVKLNTLSISFLHSMYIYDPQQAIYHEFDTNDPLFLEIDWINTINRDFHNEIKQIHKNLIDIDKFDEKLIKIFFLIILFSNHFDLKHSTTSINTMNMFKAQNIYTDLFYKYCLQHYGFDKASILLLKYTTNMIKLQNTISLLKSTACHYMDIQQLTPVMQSLF